MIRHRQFSGYTILELMISLALLGTLMMVAWSILGSYRVAEQRGWNQAYQMSMIRVTRSQLESDAACLAQPYQPPSALDGEPISGEFRLFKGDANGFSVDILPPFDPLPWLDEMTRGAEPITSTTDAMNLENHSLSTALDPLTIHHLTYEIIADKSSDDDEEVFQLQRRLSPIDRWNDATQTLDVDRILSTADLYRMGDEEDVITNRSSATRTSRIRNLVAARFRYSDGNEWTDQWDSQLKGQLPRAIEFCFDFPSASNPYRIDPPAESSVEDISLDGQWDDPSVTQDVASLESTATVSADGDALQRDVRIVVFVSGSAACLSCGELR
ncbi:hypothetical protein Q31b_11860 [Novipirellula aureliae]|uniref:Pseudopilin GspJ n=1 Tax=Novipirellula aureliae TaxID=2527966 RepID=A0A5C6EAV0_9BACT|nr:prepilin-type N-terminal cleavage/methylation domain-containing protein [Novipirellula aureliae]TWU46008.1 hypothetical protein Q31b_11860 [Novipirellula aureliae]